MFFITICTTKRSCLFADPENPYLLTPEGIIARDYWFQIPSHFSHIETDAFVVMPDHIHGILHLHIRPFQIEKMSKPVRGSISTAIRSYKSAVTRQIHLELHDKNSVIWQNRFYSHRIESKQELLAIRKYIQNNPKTWLESARDIF